MTDNKTKAWFKQFWPWFLIILPMCAVVAGIRTFNIANDNKPDMVVDDYYKQGKAINSDLSLLKNAQTLGISADVTHQDNQLLITVNGTKDKSSINLSLYHSTLSNRDMDQLLTANGQGQYSFSPDASLKGKWQIRIEPFDKSWRLQETVILPKERFSL